MAEVIIVIHLLIVLALVVLVLLQKSEGGGLGMGGGGNFMTARGTANVLTRTTSILAVAFFLTSMTLSILATQNRQPRSILDQGTPASQQGPAGSPQIPSTGQGVLDQLQQLRQQQAPAQQPAPPPTAPAPGGGPAVPPPQ